MWCLALIDLITVIPACEADFAFNLCAGGSCNNRCIPVGSRPACNRELHSGRDGRPAVRLAAVGPGVRAYSAAAAVLPRQVAGSTGQCSWRGWHAALDINRDGPA